MDTPNVRSQSLFPIKGEAKGGFLAPRRAKHHVKALLERERKKERKLIRRQTKGEKKTSIRLATIFA